MDSSLSLASTMCAVRIRPYLGTSWMRLALFLSPSQDVEHAFFEERSLAFTVGDVAVIYDMNVMRKSSEREIEVRA
jgi:hypothetical protein